MRLSPLLIIHICGGSAGLLAGTVAMAVRKGARWHRVAGQVFVGGMLCLGASGVAIAYMRAETPNIIAGLLAIYMVTTAWFAGRHKDGRTGAFDWVALVFAFGVAAYLWPLGVEALNRPHKMMNGVPAAMSFFLGTVVVLAAVGDVRMLARGGITGAQRIGRHAWRMSFGLFIATGSFFLGQQQVFPVRWRGSLVLMVLGLFPLGLLVFWVVRVRFGKQFREMVKQRFAVRSQSALPSI
ncbi:MAG: DUF2306 domain-containing protein [Terracidiphilus sp.]|jgi:uncharacterized membrane protein